MPRHRRRRRGGSGSNDRGPEGAEPRQENARPQGGPQGGPRGEIPDGERRPRPDRKDRQDRQERNDRGHRGGPDRGHGDQQRRHRGGRDRRDGRRPDRPQDRPRHEHAPRPFLPGPRSRTGDTFLIRGASLVTFDPPAVERADLLVRGGLIAGKARSLPVPPDAEVVDAKGRVLIPGLVDLCADYAARPFAGMPVPDLAGQDRARAEAASHDEASVICRVFANSVRAVLRGVTTVFDLHSTPRFCAGAPTRLRDVLLTAGQRAVIAYRVTQGGSGSAELEATREALRLSGGEQLRAAIGIGDAAQISPDTLRRLVTLRDEEEAPVLCEVRSKEGAVALKEAGLLDARTLAGVLDPSAAGAVRGSDATAVILPRAMLAPGAKDLFHPSPLPGAGLGSGSHNPDVLAAARLVAGLAEGAGAADPAGYALSALARGHAVASAAFEVPLGSFEPGSAADLVLLEVPMTLPLNAATVAALVAYGFAEAQVRMVMVAGRPVVRDGRHATVDMDALFLQVQRGALDHWQRLTGVPFPGLAELRDEPEPEPAPQAAGVDAEDEPEDDDQDVGDEDLGSEAGQEESDDEGDDEDFEEDGDDVDDQDDADEGADEEDEDEALDSDDDDEDDDEEDENEEEDEDEEDRAPEGFGAGIFL